VPKKLWVISELYYPEETSTGHFLTKIAEGLAEHFPVSVLCGQPSYSARGRRAPVREVHSGVNIRRCWATTFDKDVLGLRLINLATISFTIFLQALWRISKRDHVLVVTNPPLLPFFTAFACRLRGAKCILLIHDVYPEVLIATGMSENGALLTRLIYWLNQRLYRNVDQIVVLGRDMKALVAKKLSNDTSHVSIIPNWGDLNEVVPGLRNQNRLLHELDLSEKFIVQYAGNIGRTHGIESLLESVGKLRDSTDIHFLFVGWGAKRRWLEQAIQRNDLRNMTLLPNQPRNELSNLLNACDVAIISFVPGMAGISVPSRMYNILAAGKPIIAVTDSDSELALVVREEKVGWVVSPEQPDKITEAIQDARAHPERLSEMSKRARLAAENKYSFDEVIRAYTSLFNSIDGNQ
jgi:colanic acid biosynthesis glycosyl transferase WcaI